MLQEVIEIKQLNLPAWYTRGVEDLSAYPGLIRKKSGVYALRMRVPKDIAALIEGDPTIWTVMAVNPGARLGKWRDALTNVKRGQSITVKKELYQSLSARTLADARAPYFALRNELEAAFQAIRSAYSHEPVLASEKDLIALSDVYFDQIEAEAERNATDLVGYPDEQEVAVQNTLEDIAAIQSGNTTDIGSFQRQSTALLIEHGFSISNDTRRTLAGLLMRQALRSWKRSIDRYRGDFASGPAPSASAITPSGINAAQGTGLQDTLDLYLSEKRKLQLKSVEYLEAFGVMMCDFFGPDKQVCNISRQDARAFLHMLEHLPPNASKHRDYRHMTAPEASRSNEDCGGQTIAPATLNKHFSNFRAFLQFCVAEEITNKNVALGLKGFVA